MNKKGFTLIEIIAVVAILGLLAIVGIPNIIKMFSKSVEETMHIQENQVLDAGKLFLEDYCRNPVDNSYKSYCNEHANTLFLFGDVDNNDTINLRDAQLIKNYINGEAELKEPFLEMADVNLDGAINFDDSDDIKFSVAGNITLPDKVYYCISDLKDKGYLKDEIKAKSATCDGFVAFSKKDRNYSNGKTYLYCGENEYSTIGFNDANFAKFKSALTNCNVNIAGAAPTPMPEPPTPSSFTITYNANGGSGAPESQTKGKDEDIVLSSNIPTRDYSTFTSWNTSADGSGTSYSKGSTYSNNSDLVLYAQYNCDACHYPNSTNTACVINYGNGEYNTVEKGYRNKISALYKDQSGNIQCHSNLLDISWQDKVYHENGDSYTSNGNYAMDDYITNEEHGYCSDDSLSTYGFYRYFTGTHESWQSVCTDSGSTYASCSATVCNKGPINSTKVTQLGGKYGFSRPEGYGETSINVTASSSPLLFFVNLRDEGCGYDDKEVSNVLFKMDDGEYATLKQLVDNNIIEPLVLINGANFNEFNNFSERLYKGMELGQTDFFNIIVIFTLKQGHKFNGIKQYQTKRSKNGESEVSYFTHAICADGTFVRYVSTDDFNLVLKNAS